MGAGGKAGMTGGAGGRVGLLLSEPLRGKRKKHAQWSQSVMKMLIMWFVVLIVFSVLSGKLSEVPDMDG
jgi:hypothetical protein